MPNRHPTLTSLFNDIADAIRIKGVGSTDGDLIADDFDYSISNIVTLREGTSGDTATASDVLSGKKAHTANGAAITGTMANNGATGGTITSQGGTYTIPAGYTSGGTVTSNLTAGDYTPSVASHSITTTPVVTPSVGGTVANIVTATKPSGTDGTDYWTLDPGGSVTTTGKSSTTAKAVIGTAGYLAKNTTGKTTSADVIDITPTVAAGTNSYIEKASSSSTQPTASATNGTASVTKQPSASASTSVTGMVTTSTNTGYSVSATASSGSGTISATGGSASTTAGSVTVGVGYNPSEVTVSVSAKSASGTSASTTEVTKSASDTKYIQKGVLGASVSVSGGSASMAAKGFTAASSATSYYVTLSTSSGSATGSASVSTEGYVKSETASSGASAVSVSGNGNKLYVPAGSYSASGTASGGSASIAASGFTAADAATTHYVTLSTSAGSVTPKATIGTAGYIPTGNTTGDAVSVAVSGNGNKIYIPDGAHSATATKVSNGSASMAATSNVPTSSSETDYYITLTTSAGSAKATSTIGTAGYLATESVDSSSNVSIPVNGNGNKIYLDVVSSMSGHAVPY